MFSLIAAAELTMDGPYWISILSRVVHTTCAATLLGGLIYLRFVLAPAAAEPGQIPISGDWDGDGADEPGVYSPAGEEAGSDETIRVSRRAG